MAEQTITMISKLRNLIATHNILPGDRLIYKAFKIWKVDHHLIYLGNYHGIDYAIDNSPSAGVNVQNMDEMFSDNLPQFKLVRFQPLPSYSRNNLVKLAIKSVGKKYNAVNFNCEHFCNWLQGKGLKSDQVRTTINWVAGISLGLLIIKSISINSNNNK